MVLVHIGDLGVDLLESVDIIKNGLMLMSPPYPEKFRSSHNNAGNPLMRSTISVETPILMKLVLL